MLLDDEAPPESDRDTAIDLWRRAVRARLHAAYIIDLEAERQLLAYAEELEAKASRLQSLPP